MMKRPRSFIPTLLIFYCLATVSFGLTTHARRAEAGAMPRVMDPRAGDPSEPSDGLADSGNSSTSPGESDPVAVQTPRPLEIRNYVEWSWSSLARALSFFFLGFGRR